MSLNLDQTSTIVDGALAHARKMQVRPICVAVLDDGGHLIALKRDDGATFLRPQIAIAKAWGALGMGRSSRSLGERFGDRFPFVAALTALTEGRVVPVPGGLLVCAGEDVIGAVGVSGASSDEDEACALAGIRTAGFESCPD